MYFIKQWHCLEQRQIRRGFVCQEGVFPICDIFVCQCICISICIWKVFVSHL